MGFHDFLKLDLAIYTNKAREMLDESEWEQASVYDL